MPALLWPITCPERKPRSERKLGPARTTCPANNTSNAAWDLLTLIPIDKRGKGQFLGFMHNSPLTAAPIITISNQNPPPEAIWLECDPLQRERQARSARFVRKRSGELRLRSLYSLSCRTA